MKSLTNILFLALLALLAGSRPASAAERFRTDINPGLLYWQAWVQLPALPQADHDYLFTNEWRGRVLDDRFNDLVSRYGQSFKLLRRAAKAQVPCEWGYDLTDGPYAILPGLAKGKVTSQAARLRVLWHLQKGDQSKARDELVAAFTQGRNISRDGILISCLVQIAIENICISVVAENFHRFSPQNLQEIVAGFDASPARGSILRCVTTEKNFFAGWLTRTIGDFRAELPSEQEVMAKVRETISDALNDQENPDPKLVERVISAAGGTSEGLIRYVRELDPLYDEVAEILALPYQDFLTRIKTFNEKIGKHTNLLAKHFFTVFDKCRKREFGAELKLAMLRAAVAHRVSGEAGLREVLDPLYREPFEFRRFEFEGVDRGFELRSKADWRGWPEAQIFVEEEGPPFYLEGKSIGKKLK